MLAAMGMIRWGDDPEFFGPRHAHREGRILRALEGVTTPLDTHLECAAGLGTLTLSLARRGARVTAADASLRSLVVLIRRARNAGLDTKVHPVVADITRLPFANGVFATATTAETLEHIPDDQGAAAELGRVLAPGGYLVGSVPANPGQWSVWDEWAGHLRRYSAHDMQQLLGSACLKAKVTVWGWPILRVYDGLFLRRIQGRRLRHQGPNEADPSLRRVERMGRRRWLVKLVRTVFELDRLFDGVTWGVGLLFVAERSAESPRLRGTTASRSAHDPRSP